MKLIRKKPVIHFHGHKLMCEDIKKRRKKGGEINITDWLREKSEEVNLPYGTLYKYIYKHRPVRANEDKLVQIFGKKVFTVTWEEIKN